MKVINDQENPHPAEDTIPRKTIDAWQRKDQARRSEGDGQNHKNDPLDETKSRSNAPGERRDMPWLLMAFAVVTVVIIGSALRLELG